MILLFLPQIEQTMLEFIKKLQEIYPLSTDSVEILFENMEKVSLPKGILIVEVEKVESYAYLIFERFSPAIFL